MICKININCEYDIFLICQKKNKEDMLVTNLIAEFNSTLSKVVYIEIKFEDKV